jgi:hypothetical protein
MKDKCENILELSITLCRRIGGIVALGRGVWSVLRCALPLLVGEESPADIFQLTLWYENLKAQNH